MNDRYSKMLEMRKAGMTYWEIGLAFNVTGNRVCQVIKNAERLSRLEKYGLSAKGYNCFHRMVRDSVYGYRTGMNRDELKELVVSHLNNGGYLHNVRGLGEKTLSEIAKFLGIPLEFAIRKGYGGVVQKGDTNEYTG